MINENVGTVEVENSNPAEAVETQQPDVAEQEEVEVDNDAEDAQDDTPFPKKAVNALSRAKKQANKYKGQAEALRVELEQMRAQVAKYQGVEKKPEPKIDDFQDIQSYLKAMAQHTAQDTINQQNGQQAQERLSALEQQQRAVLAAQREEVIAEKAIELINANPEARQIMEKYSPLFDMWEQQAPQLVELIYALDNAPTAIYNLAIDGKLEELSYMPPQLAAAALYQAQFKQPTPKATVSNAPKPINANKGNGTGLKQLADLSPDELMKRLKL